MSPPTSTISARSAGSDPSCRTESFRSKVLSRPPPFIPRPRPRGPATTAPPPSGARPVNPAAHVAIIPWDVCADGLVPVARSHFEVLAAGAAITLESRLEQNMVILSSLALPSFASLASTVMPWLLVGGTLALHHPFDHVAFAQQCKAEQCQVIVVPGPLALRLAEGGVFSRRDGAKTVIAPWRAPEQLAGRGVAGGRVGWPRGRPARCGAAGRGARPPGAPAPGRHRSASARSWRRAAR